LGGTLIFPFFALYITQKFNVGMTQAGVLLAIFSLSGLVGSMLGGALTDRFGRRGIVLFGLTISALSSVAMGLVENLNLFYFLAVFVGLLSDVGGPARQAMIADLLPAEQRAEGFGIMRVVGNLAWIFGPTIGGFLAARSYLLLFILDAITSMITAGIVYRMIPETMPQREPGTQAEGVLNTLRGYAQVARDRLFLQFVIASLIMTLVYIQMYSTLSVYLRDVHGLPTQGFGALLSMNAFVVVLLQFWVTRKVSRRPPLLMMALGSSLYLVGFLAYGVVSGFVLFAIAMLFITFGEMVVMPVSQALAVRFAPEDKRGRYLAFFGLSWAIPQMIGPWMAGRIMDTLDPRWVWYGGGILLGIAILVFIQLHIRANTYIESMIAASDSKIEA
jgi:MFS family permease